jgi:predicted dehydrogenase
MAPLGLGLIGYGGFGRFCAGAYSNMAEARLVAVADVDAAQRAAAQEHLGVRTFATAEALIAAPDIQIVHIGTPPSTHAPLALAAARASKHVFCEKPLALSLVDADAVIDVCAHSAVRLTVNYVLRYNPLNRRLRELLRSGLLGPVLSMSLENLATDEALKPGHWFWDKGVSGGIWVEHGVHFFDLFSWLNGEAPRAVSAFARTRRDGCQDRVWAVVDYADDLVATYQHAFTQPARFEQTTIRLVCARGYVTLHGWIQTRLELEALVDEPGLQAIRAWAGCEPEIVEGYSGAAAEGWSFGAPYLVAARIRLSLDLPEGKAAVYRASIREGLLDLVRGIHHPQHAMEVTPEAARQSLAIALASVQATNDGNRALSGAMA